MSEWDNTPWAGTVPKIKAVQIIDPPVIHATSISPSAHAKAVTSITPWANGIPLSSLTDTPQKKAAAYLKAYRVGWFNKAGRKISGDVGSLDWTISEGDTEEGMTETTLERPSLSIPFDGLAPIDQLQRLLERPNPKMTGRQLLQKLAIHHDFAGASCIWLEGGDGGLPSALWPISPARMTPSRDKQGRLIGWVMDVQDKSTSGVPFTADEILWTATATADEDDLWGVSVVEAVYSEVPLADLMARHTANVLTTGGRLAGMMWPKSRSLDENEYMDAQRAWRNVASDPDAAKRLLIFPEPMEWQQGSSTPADIGIPELALLSRDTILTAFPISPYILGIPEPGGLNSGLIRQEDRRDYWEGTIHPRADLIEESFQVQLVSRYERETGRTYDFEIAEPDMDNAAALIEKVAALRALADAGFDEKESVKTVGLSHIKFVAIPPPVAPPVPEIIASTVAGGLPKDNVSTTAKAVHEPMVRGRSALTRFLQAQKARVIAKVTEAAPSKYGKADVNLWPDDEDEELRKAIRSLYLEVGRDGLQVVADTLGRIVANRQVRDILADLNAYGGERIVNINLATKEAVQQVVAEGVRRGYSLNQIIEGVPDEGYSGVSAVGLANGTEAWSELRAETIARTETMLSYNRAQVTSYGAFGVQTLEAYDGDQDEECAARAGQEFTVEEALAIEDHPNGTLVWSPVLDKAWHEPESPVEPLVQNFIIKAPDTTDLTPVVAAMASLRDDLRLLEHDPADLIAAMKAINPPVVNVEAPVVNVDSPVINVQPPEVTIEPPTIVVNTGETHVTTPEVTVNLPEPAPITVNLPEQAAPVVTVNLPEPAPVTVNLPEFQTPQVTVNLPEQRPTRKVIERDAKGVITSITSGNRSSTVEHDDQGRIVSITEET